MTTEMTDGPVGTLGAVLAALGDPVRLEMVRRMWVADERVPCAQLYDGISKSTASYHFKVLREAGVIRKIVDKGKPYQELRKADLAAAYGALVESVMHAANH